MFLEAELKANHSKNLDLSSIKDKNSMDERAITSVSSEAVTHSQVPLAGVKPNPIFDQDLYDRSYLPIDLN